MSNWYCRKNACANIARVQAIIVDDTKLCIECYFNKDDYLAFWFETPENLHTELSKIHEIMGL